MKGNIFTDELLHELSIYIVLMLIYTEPWYNTFKHFFLERPFLDLLQFNMLVIKTVYVQTQNVLNNVQSSDIGSDLIHKGNEPPVYLLNYTVSINNNMCLFDGEVFKALNAVKVVFVACKGVFVAYIFYCTNQCAFILHIWYDPYFCSKWNHSTVNWRQTLTDGGSVWSSSLKLFVAT